MNDEQRQRLENQKAAAERAIARHAKAAEDNPRDAERFLRSVAVAKADIARIDEQLAGN